jgi:hypothetical protein
MRKRRTPTEASPMRGLKFLRSSSVKAKTPGKQAEQEPSSDALQPLTELSRQPGATEVSKLRSMDQDRRLSLSQAQVSGERDSRLLKRRMVLWGSLALLYFWACASAIAAQQELWSKQGAIGLMGPEASVIVPMLISLWFLGGVFIATRRMVHRPSSKRWFELMLFFNLSVSLSHIIVAVGVVREAFLLGFSVVGNSLPAAGEAQTDGSLRLGALVVLHYYTSVFELMDTFFLVARKKIGKSLGLHVWLRLQHVWNWFIAACFACGGDCYFPLFVSAAASALLHLSYTRNLLWHRDTQGLDLFQFVNNVKVWTLWPALLFGLATFVVGSVPRWVSAVYVVEMYVGLILFSNFHHDNPAAKRFSVDDQQGASKKAILTYSFDSSGWCFLYHFGAAMWIQENFKREIGDGEIAFSGSSGGAIVAACSGMGLDLEAIVGEVIGFIHDRCQYRPWGIPVEVNSCLDRHFPADAHAKASDGRLRVLMTRLRAQPPFIMGEVANRFEDRETLLHCLQASSQIPIVFGMAYYIPSTRAYYLDGLLWMTAFVPWRAAGNSPVCRVSAFNNFGSDVGPTLTRLPPMWWILFPPSKQVLRGMVLSGYCDMATQFEKSNASWTSKAQRGFKTRKDMTEVKALVQEYRRACVNTWLVFFGVCSAGTVVILGALLAFYYNCFYGVDRGHGIRCYALF